jgi:hypothetical protein
MMSGQGRSERARDEQEGRSMGHRGMRAGWAWVLVALVAAGPARADFSYQMTLDGTIQSVYSVVPGPGGVSAQLAPGVTRGTDIVGSGWFVTDGRGLLTAADLRVATTGPTDFGFVFDLDPATDRGIYGGRLPLVIRGGAFPSTFTAVAPSLTPTDLVRQFILVESKPGVGYLNIDLEHRTATGVADYYVDAVLPRFKIVPEPSSLALALLGLAALRVVSGVKRGIRVDKALTDRPFSTRIPLFLRPVGAALARATGPPRRSR